MGRTAAPETTLAVMGRETAIMTRGVKGSPYVGAITVVRVGVGGVKKTTVVSVGALQSTLAGREKDTARRTLTAGALAGHNVGQISVSTPTISQP